MATRRYFTIVEDSGVSDTLAAAIALDPRIEQVYDALTWRLARDPMVGTPVSDISGGEHRAVFFRPLKVAKNQIVLARYRVDEVAEQVLLDKIVILPYDASVGYAPEAFDIDA